jgi:ATP-dependent phosphoenolpyruvate carboxykinase
MDLIKAALYLCGVVMIILTGWSGEQYSMGEKIRISCRKFGVGGIKDCDTAREPEWKSGTFS